MYIWQDNQWPNFQYQADVIDPKLDKLLLLQQQLIGKAKSLPEGYDRQAEMDALIQNAIKTSEIEGEKLNVGSVRSSVAKHLGLEQAGLPQSTRQTESLVAMLCAATSDLLQPISQQLLCQWQSSLFPEASLIRNIIIGDLRGDALMQVVSQKGRQEVVHFEAPPKAQLKKELKNFFDWFNHKKTIEMHGIIRAAIAHLWLITIHPFDDGNGRVTRAITDRALAQDENTSIRFYSLSAAIENNRASYYEILEYTQNCKTETQKTPGSDVDITEWISWFLDVMSEAIRVGQERIEHVLNKSRFWHAHSQTILNKRQIKVLNRLLDGVGDEFKQGINASKYKNITDVSKATATRDLTELVDKGCLQLLLGGGRSTRYTLDFN